MQALHAALKKLDEGSVRDAKAVCGNDLLQQVSKWKVISLCLKWCLIFFPHCRFIKLMF